MNRDNKQQIVSELHDVFNSVNIVVVTHYSGLTVAEATDLRRRMKASGAIFQVTKNRLVKRAIAGTQYSPISDMFSGPAAIAVSEDPVAAAKVAVEFSKENEKLIIIGGALGPETLDSIGVRALAELPSLDELRAKLVGTINSPAQKLVGVLQAPAGNLARVVSAYGSKKDVA
tara:strand:- start:79832 stop:80350 length:519 start_codon:yes stop_codon:yes gene_type:complete